ncbi:MAG: FG-GAP repeat protein, partial [Chloroflexota bacterium]
MQRRLSIFLVLILTAMTVTVQAADTPRLPQGQITLEQLPADLQHTIFSSIRGDMASAPLASDVVPEQQAYLKAENTGADDNFGVSVGVDGDTVVVGAPFEDGSATTVNGSDDDSADDAGAAYVFVRNGSTWSQQAYLKAENAGSGDQFGYSVAVDGDTVVVGAYLEDGSATTVNGPDDNSASAAGAAYVFVRSGSTWTQEAYLKADNAGSGDRFGYSVAVDGDTVVVGAYTEDGSATTVNGPDDNLAGAAGAAYVFTRVGSTWSQQAYLKADNAGVSDFFGYSVAVDGDTVVVGAVIEDGSATTVNGPDDDLAGNAGAAYVFTRVGSTWSQQAYLKAENAGASDQFGWSVAVDGDTVVVGAIGEDGSATTVNGANDNAAGFAGAAYVFAPPLPEPDVDGNGLVTPADAIYVINRI